MHEEEPGNLLCNHAMISEEDEEIEEDLELGLAANEHGKECGTSIVDARDT